MTSSLGHAWRSSFVDFNPIPFAAASIGQVHHATLTASASPTGQPERVAVKIQFPNIAESVASDLSYIRLLLTAGRLLPRGLFLDKTLTVIYSPPPSALFTNKANETAGNR
jgi:aarF domain-containing kinase